MGHLVQDGLAAALVAVAGFLGGEHVFVAEGDGSGVFHGAGVELGHEQLVVFAEGVGDAEVGVVEVEALLGFAEQPLGVEVVGEGGAAVDGQRDFQFVRLPGRGLRVVGKCAAPGVGDLVITARADGDQVGR